MKEREAAVECLKRVDSFFRNDASKVAIWFMAPNPLLGGVSPAQMVAVGRADKLLSFIKSREEGAE